MNEKNVVICDSEFRYASSLGENISARRELAVKVFVCSNMEKVHELAKIKTVHIFVVDEKYAYEERCQVNTKQVFVLSKGHVTDLGKTEREIFKYQCADEIIREIFEVYIDKTKENIVRCIRKEKTELVAVYSPIHRVGKTRFAIAFGKEKAKKEQVLYLNMEEYAGFTDATDEDLNLGDLLYYIKQGSGNLGGRLQVAVRKMEELDYILPISISLDLKDVTEKEWLTLLEEIMENSAYQVVVLDLGESVQGLFQILEMCDRVYMPILEDTVSKRKLKRFEKNMERLRLEKLPHAIHRFVMPEQIEEYARIRVKEEG